MGVRLEALLGLIGCSLILSMFLDSPQWQADEMAEQAELARAWPQTTAEIVRSGVKQIRTPVFGFWERVQDVPDVEYRYRVNGRIYRSERAWFGEVLAYSRVGATPRGGPVLHKGEYLRNYMARHYPQGKQVTISYNSRYPHQAVLEQADVDDLAYRYKLIVVSCLCFVLIWLIFLLETLGIINWTYRWRRL